MKDLDKFKYNDALNHYLEFEKKVIQNKFENTFDLINLLNDIPTEIKQNIYENLRKTLEVYEVLNVISVEINALKTNTKFLDKLIQSPEGEIK
jgi:hypothetical protein